MMQFLDKLSTLLDFNNFIKFKSCYWIAWLNIWEKHTPERVLGGHWSCITKVAKRPCGKVYPEKLNFVL